MASPTQWIWVWASSGSWWWTGKPGVLQSMGWKQLDTTDQLNNNRYSCQIIAKTKEKIFTEMTSKLSFRNVVIHLTQSTINGCFYHLKFTQQKLKMIGPSDSTILFNQLATERIFESQPFDCKAHHTWYLWVFTIGTDLQKICHYILRISNNRIKRKKQFSDLSFGKFDKPIQPKDSDLVILKSSSGTEVRKSPAHNIKKWQENSWCTERAVPMWAMGQP